MKSKQVKRLLSSEIRKIASAPEKYCVNCNLRRRAAADALANGHPALINGHPLRPVFK